MPTAERPPTPPPARPVQGCWVAYGHSDQLTVHAVFADELSARRWAMDHYDPMTDVTLLPYGVDISDHLKRPADNGDEYAYAKLA